MDGSSQEGEVKKQVTEIKTYPVPFALGENQGNITVTTNTSSKPSKEQIIHQAIQFHLKGNIQEAAKLYNYFMMPAMILSWIFGLLLIGSIGFTEIGKSWLQLKLLFVLILTVYHLSLIHI